jgi:20S proteasome alpha/beta subunit
MTTIAYKDGVIAYDSRITANTTITNDDYEKCHEVKGVKFVLSGKTSDYAKLIDAYFGGSASGDLQASAVIVDAEGLWYAGRNNEDGFWKSPIVGDGPYAIGSGGDHAFTAMDMGATAYQAVEMAMKRDSCTGGKIRTLMVKPADPAA